MVESSEASDISSLINESLVQTRTVARGLFPVRLEEEGLTDAVEELTVNIGKLYKIKCDFSSTGALPTMHNGVAMHLHFIAQEAIMNAAKHSQASGITVHLLKENDDLVLSVKDDGVGFLAGNQDRAGMGIGIMRVPCQSDRRPAGITFTAGTRHANHLQVSSTALKLFELK